MYEYKACSEALLPGARGLCLGRSPKCFTEQDQTLTQSCAASKSVGGHGWRRLTEGFPAAQCADEGGAVRGRARRVPAVLQAACAGAPRSTSTVTQGLQPPLLL